MVDGLLPQQIVRRVMTDIKEGEHTVDASGKQTDSKNNATKTPEELAKIADDQRKRAEIAEGKLKTAEEAKVKAEAEATEAKAKLEKAGNSEGDLTDAEITKIAEEFDVDPKFATALTKAISSKNEKAITKAKEDLQGEISKRDADTKTKEFNEAFGEAFTKATEDLEGVTVDKEAVKTVFLERVKENKELTVAEVVAQMYGQASGRTSSEDDVRGGGEGGGTAIDFDSVHKDPKKLSAVLADPASRSKYYAWRDSKNM